MRFIKWNLTELWADIHSYNSAAKIPAEFDLKVKHRNSQFTINDGNGSKSITCHFLPFTQWLKELFWHFSPYLGVAVSSWELRRAEAQSSQRGTKPHDTLGRRAEHKWCPSQAGQGLDQPGLVDGVPAMAGGDTLWVLPSQPKPYGILCCIFSAWFTKMDCRCNEIGNTRYFALNSASQFALERSFLCLFTRLCADIFWYYINACKAFTNVSSRMLTVKQDTWPANGYQDILG